MRLPLLGVVATALVLSGLALPIQAEEVAGTVYFDAAGTTIDPATTCNGVEYPATLAVPTTEGKGYVDLGVVGLSCSFYFTLTVPEAFAITGEVTANLFVGCEAASVAPGTPATTSWRFALEDMGGNDIGTEYQSSEVVTCQTGALTQLTATIPDAAIELNAGDQLKARLIFFAVNPPPAPQGNLYVATGVAGSLSGFTAPGIPGGPAVSGSEAINLSVAEAQATAQPGGQATWDLTVVNAGDATTFTLATVGLSESYAAQFAPASGSLAVNATAASTLRVDIPDDAEDQTTLQFQVKVTGTQGANKTVDLTLKVSTQPTTTGTGTGTATGTGTRTGTGTGIRTGTGTGDDTGTGTGNNGAPGFEFLANFAAITGLVLLMRRRLAK